MQAYRGLVQILGGAARACIFRVFFWLAVLVQYWLGGREELSVNIGEEGPVNWGGLPHGISR